MVNQNKKIIVLGGGPTGMGTAYRLRDLGYKNWKLFEKNDYFGGQSATHKDKKGFLWDEGGHLLFFSQYPYFEKFIEEVLDADYYAHQRENWIKLSNAWVPYPFQNNIRYLPAEEQLKCLLGLARVGNPGKKSKNFKEWIINTFGQGIADIFMIPYNLAMWHVPLEKMSKDWIAQRISVIDFERTLSNVIFQKDDVSWGPNHLFKFPKQGGIGEIYQRAAELFKGKAFLNHEVIAIDFKKKSVAFKNGKKENYDYLISSLPLDKLIALGKNLPKAIRQMVKELVYNNILVIGLGLKKQIKTSKCWVYFTAKNTPFYRLTFFHNYSPYNVPKGNIKKYSSLMCEISYAQNDHPDKQKIIEQTIAALIKNGILENQDIKKIISKSVYDVSYAYPVPTLNRDKILKKVQPFLMKNNIFSRGRFGAWKYEIGNMDHCFMQGVEAVDKILKNKKETVWSL